MLKHGKAFRVLKVDLKESEKICCIVIGPNTGGPESVSQHGKSEFLGHLKVGRGSSDAAVLKSMGET
jgi:hypothetical protein